MAKLNKGLNFKNAVITKDSDTGIFTITESVKDGENIYNLTDKINDWLNIEGMSLTFKKDDELESEA